MTRKEYSIHWLTPIDDSLDPIHWRIRHNQTVHTRYLSTFDWAYVCIDWTFSISDFDLKLPSSVRLEISKHVNMKHL